MLKFLEIQSSVESDMVFRTRVRKLLLLTGLFLISRIMQGSIMNEYHKIPVLWFSGGTIMVALLITPRTWWFPILLLQGFIQIIFLWVSKHAIIYSGLIASTFGPLLSTVIFLWLNKKNYSIASLSEFINTLVSLLIGALFSAIVIYLSRWNDPINITSLSNFLLAPITGDVIILFLFTTEKPQQWVRFSSKNLKERIFFLGMLVLTILFMVGYDWSFNNRIEIHYLFFPLFFIMAMRISAKETMISLLAIILIFIINSSKASIWATGLVNTDENQLILSIQIFLFVLTTGTILVSIIRKQNQLAFEKITEKEELYKTLVDNLPQRIFLKNTDSSFISGNKAFMKEIGIVSENLTGRHDADFFAPPFLEVMEKSDLQVIHEKNTIEFDTPDPGNNTSGRILRVMKTPVLNAAGKLTAILGIYWDITVSKQAEKALKESEMRYKSIFNISPLGLILSDFEGRILEVNLSVSRMLGYSMEELCSRKVADIYFNAPDSESLFRKLSQTESLSSEEVQLCTSEGKTIICQVSMTIIQISGRHLILSNFMDITKQKQVEASLRASEKRLLDAEQISHAGNFELDLKTQNLFWSAGQFLIYGLSPCQESINMDWALQLVHPDDRQQLIYQMEQAARNKREFIYECRIIRPNGEIRVLLIKGKTLMNKDGVAERLVGVNLDITELKEAQQKINNLNADLEQRVIQRTQQLEDTLEKLQEREKALRHSEERFRALVEQSPLSIAIYSTEGILLQANHAWKKLWGFENTNQLIGNYNLFQDSLNLPFIHKDAFQKALEGKESIIPETILEPITTSIITRKHIRSFIYPIQNQYNSVASVAITYEDITRQKQADDILKSALSLSQSSALLTSEDIVQKGLDEAVRLSNSLIGFFHFVNPDEDSLSLQAWSSGTFQYCNATGEKLHYPISQAGVWVDAIHLRKALIHNNISDLPHRKGLPEGHCEVIRELVVPVFEEEKIAAILGVGNKAEEYDEFDLDQMSFFAQQIWNLVQMNRSNEHIRKSEYQYKTLVETIPEAVLTIDRNGKVVYASKRVAEYVGRPKTEDLAGKFLTDFVFKGETSSVISFLNKITKESGVLKTKIDFLRQDGTSLPTEINASWLSDHPGNQAEIIITARDISDRINAEKALRESEERYKKFFSDNHAIMLLIHPETGMIVDANPAACDFYGYTAEDLTAKSIMEISVLPEEDIREHILQTRLNMKSHFYSRHQLSWEEVRDVDVYTGVIQISGQELLYLIVHDDSERRKGEEQLRKLAKAQTVLLREVNHRVKNNLAALISMLHIEEDRAEAAGITNYIGLLRDLISRIRGLSTVHSLLSARNWQPLEICQLAEQVIKSTLESLPPTKSIQLKVESSPIVVSSNQAHHLAMVINELTTNTIKHALKDWDEATIHVRLAGNGSLIYLGFSDDGPGFPMEMVNGDFSKINVGFELIRGIVQHSLNGKLKLRNDKGAQIDIEFQSELT